MGRWVQARGLQNGPSGSLKGSGGDSFCWNPGGSRSVGSLNRFDALVGVSIFFLLNATLGPQSV